jgi:hypothetical protein
MGRCNLGNLKNCFPLPQRGRLISRVWISIRSLGNVIWYYMNFNCSPWIENPYMDAVERTAFGGLSLDAFLSEVHISFIMSLVPLPYILLNNVCRRVMCWFVSFTAKFEKNFENQGRLSFTWCMTDCMSGLCIFSVHIAFNLHHRCFYITYYVFWTVGTYDTYEPKIYHGEFGIYRLPSWSIICYPCD